MMKKTLLNALVVALFFTAIVPVAQAAPKSQVDGFRRMAFSGRADAKADQIVVYKGKRLMYLMRNGRILRKYNIALGKNPVGHKIEFGDYRTPEGRYTIDMKNAASAYLLSLRVSYPDAVDAQVANALDTRPGDWIMIHGLPNGRSASDVGHPNRDWTNGCIAVTDAEIVEIWQMVDRGTKISIWP